ncbi:hypothetical protein QJS10_CPA08g00101 [Acorus calamus]|uniref:Exoribonuclease phosphorolytic domain-containing protein n=1 Tax=Acorus calamus TaxID=4465 RepID=A0AAV9ECA4_ACOCL|nr:hypothetical protein QJS10_CPA08g00101 [Acorus calamus]
MLANPSFHVGPLPRQSPPRPFQSLLHRRRRPSLPFSRRRCLSPRFHPPSSFALPLHANAPSFRGIRASSVTGEAEEQSAFSPRPHSVKIPVGDREVAFFYLSILVETGHIGRQASASVMVTDGETIVYTSVCLSDVPSDPSDFFPMSVHYQERLSAAGRTSGGFFKREGRAKDHEVLICRLIDRPLRPTMPKGFYHETQISSWVFSYDGIHSPDCLAVTAAGIAVALSEVPNTKAIAGAAVRSICNAMEALVKKCGKPKMVDAIKLPPAELYRHVEDICHDELVMALQIRNKIPRRKALSTLEDKVLNILTEKGYVIKDEAPLVPEAIIDVCEDEDEDEVIVEDGEVDEGDVHIKPITRKPIPLLFSEVDVKLVFKEVTSKYLRRRIVEVSYCLVWHEIHGEVGRMGAPNRREIGHGMLAERALEPILPSEDEFPYTIRVESTITESNGSSSMASVCGGCLALLDAGVPLKSSVAGIAMGLVLETKEFGGDGTPLILSDISGSEDASGDMDFKVAGNENGITAFQMDIKVYPPLHVTCQWLFSD